MSISAVKFKTQFVGKQIPDDVRIADLRRWAKVFHAKNLAPIINGVSCGNFSFRVRPGENDFIITASQMGFDKELPTDGFVLVKDCDFAKGIITAVGSREPSSESMLHFAVYQARPEVNAVFHGHSPEILANSKKLNLVETVTQEPFGTATLAQSVLKVLGDNDFVVMKGHGFVALGEAIDEAGELAGRQVAK